MSLKKILASAIICFSSLTFSADRGDVSLNAFAGWNFDQESLQLNSSLLYYPVNEVGFGLAIDYNDFFQVSSFEVKWSIEPIELYASVGAVLRDNEGYFMASGAFSYLVALSDSMALNFFAKYYFPEKELSGVATGLGLRILL